MANQLGGSFGPASSPSANTAGSGRRPSIGPATAIRGQLSAREDLWIEGQFEGEIQAPAHQVTVSSSGRVRADVKARSVVIEGELVGNVIAERMVMLRAGAVMQGDIQAPSVALEEGCQFQGNVDMDGSQATGAKDSAQAATAPAGSGASGSTASGPTSGAMSATPALVGEGGG